MRFVRIAVAFIISAIVGAVCVLIVLAANDGVSFRSLKAYAILSGSMEPKLPLGSVVAVRPALQYSVGDIITFFPAPNNKIPVTHRVTKVYGTSTQNNLLYETKGDKNNAVDTGSIKQGQIIGKVFFYVPYIGYAVQAAKTKKGFIFLIIVPSTIIIYEELKTLKKELANLLKKLKSSKTNGRALVFVPMIASIFVLTSYSRAFFSDHETSAANSFQAGIWGTTPSPTVEPTPTTIPEIPTSTPTPAPTLQIVLNEVFYFVDDDHKIGNSESGSEWVELYNPTSNAVNLSGWSIEDNTSCDNFPGSPTISAGGFAIISIHAEAEFRAIWTSIPTGVIFIQSPTAIGNGLANNDELILHDQLCGTTSEIDHISWGSNIDGLDPSIPMVDRGHSSERDPDGKDTDTAADFIDRSTPTPGS